MVRECVCVCVCVPVTLCVPPLSAPSLRARSRMAWFSRITVALMVSSTATSFLGMYVPEGHRKEEVSNRKRKYQTGRGSIKQEEEVSNRKRKYQTRRGSVNRGAEKEVVKRKRKVFFCVVCVCVCVCV